MKAAVAMEKGRATTRNTVPGAQELLRLGKGIYAEEQEQTNYYKEEEKKLLLSSSEIEKLFESLRLRGEDK